MKKTLLSIFILFFSFASFAQLGEVEEVNADMSQGTSRGLKVLIPETNEKAVKKAWEKYIKGLDGKVEKIKKADDVVARAIIIPAVSDRAVDVYSIIKETSEGVYLTAFYDLGSAYLNSDMHADQTEATKKSLTAFAKAIVIDAINAQVSAETKTLDKLAKEQKGFEKDLEGYKKDISNAEDAIKKAEETIATRKTDIEKNGSDQEAKKKEIEEQTSKLEGVKAKLTNY